MPDKDKTLELDNPDFQAALKALLAVYQPILEQQLSLANNPDELQRQAQAEVSRTCADEFQEAYARFEKFLTEDTAARLLPAQAKELLGPVDQWRWCLQHILCCFVFGWLVCRWPRTFRGYAYYLYEFWKCVRQVIGNPVSDPPSADQRQDFETLVNILAGAFKPYLTDQLATVEYPAGIPDAIFSGKIDCFTDDQEACDIFNRLLTTEAASALLGSAAFKEQSQKPYFWFCRCWCLCALCFGCCLARARNLQQVVLCLYAYFRCLIDCFQPIRCDLTAPTGCTQEQEGLVPEAVAVEIDGTAAGAFFGHYILEWRQAAGQACADNTAFSTLGISYPGGTPTGSVPVVSGTLGWLDSTDLAGGPYDIRLTVIAAGGQQACQVCITFTLFKVLVWIDRVAELPGAPVQTPPGWFDQAVPPQAPIVNTNPGGVIVPVGGCISVVGTAWVGDCQNRKINCVDLRAAVGWQPGTAEPGFAASLPLYTIAMLPTPICYPDPDPTVEQKKRAPWNQLFETNLIRGSWVPTSIPPFDTQYCLPKICFDSGSLLPPCPDTQHGCRSGKYTILLDVTDTTTPTPNHYYDTQQVWFDNKPIHVEFDGLEGVGSCQDVCLSKYVPQGTPCNLCWPMNLLGIAFDENIDPADNTYPSNNFDYYNLSITRQGGPSYAVPITPTLCPPLFGPDQLKGTKVVGDPGTRCEEAFMSCPAPAHGAKTPNLLTMLDLRIFDAVCAADPSLASPFTPPAGFPLDRGSCCTYTFVLFAQDKTWSNSIDPSPVVPGSSGVGLHWLTSLPWAVEICNDLGSNVHIAQCP